ncbi:hypothetical protein BS50DRAFT_230067 [Corynespora cassiicola Philippines]|uniref:Uncharacterized protein n=1 Tax=Corynespora cassiicola Philippines TaxID=1448308 RepID=A0A2T2N2G1_CORCC|nr:hypothetical protein BS50DRAFT_230067 [Corynespora cassiicola Philippines]
MHARLHSTTPEPPQRRPCHRGFENRHGADGTSGLCLCRAASVLCLNVLHGCIAHSEAVAAAPMPGERRCCRNCCTMRTSSLGSARSPAAPASCTPHPLPVPLSGHTLRGRCGLNCCRQPTPLILEPVVLGPVSPRLALTAPASLRAPQPRPSCAPLGRSSRALARDVAASGNPSPTSLHVAPQHSTGPLPTWAPGQSGLQTHVFSSLGAILFCISDRGSGGGGSCPSIRSARPYAIGFLGSMPKHHSQSHPKYNTTVCVHP